MSRLTYFSIFFKFGLYTFLSISLLSCHSTNTVTKTTTSDQKEWKLIWEDTFAKDGFLDPEKWNIIEQNTADWENYISDHEDCIWIKDGKLILRGIVNDDRKILLVG